MNPLICALAFFSFFNLLQAIDPFLPEVCGSKWQIDYATLHEKALKGETRDHKYIINIPVRSGSADNLLGFISMFLWALLTDRVFIKYQSENLPMIELAYDPRTFNWLAPHNPIDAQIDCVAELYANVKYPPCNHTAVKVLDTDIRESRPYASRIVGFDTAFWHNDMRKYPNERDSEKELMLPVSARGFMHQMFKNPYHNETLLSWGLKPETIFGCLFNYLLKPKPEVCQLDINGTLVNYSSFDCYSSIVTS